jgi:hypothetical protein
MPISLAASSQTQIGSAPFSNLRQRLSQSIIGTKQLKVEETDSGSPFFIQTRNRAGCSPSLVQEVGLRIRSLPGLCPRCRSTYSPLPKNWGCGVAWRDEAQSGVQTLREDCTVVRRQDFGNKGHSASAHAQCHAHLREPEPCGAGAIGGISFHVGF